MHFCEANAIVVISRLIVEQLVCLFLFGFVVGGACHSPFDKLHEAIRGMTHKIIIRLQIL